MSDTTAFDATTEAAPDPMLRRIADKDAVLEAAFTNAAFDGWSLKTLERSTQEAGLDKMHATRLFPRGTHDLLDWIDDWADRRMLEAVPETTLLRVGIRRRVELLIDARLDVLGPHQEGLRRALLTRGLPHNALGSLRSLWRTADRIWDAVGVDEDQRSLSHYSRRATLAALLVSIMLYWFEDHSPQHVETRAFVRRRLDDVLRLGKRAGSARQILDRLPRLRPRLNTLVERSGFHPVRPGHGPKRPTREV
ncbi:ubiquinone biosynthesis protein COQ9 [Arboricoccus pini]|uniref:Ubiquinone biosynthesis protein COQ9 n=1 Tax=Arboricoccus pini TaxID=1963835 RepID=A0A212RZG8_9PROT|nr:COQ9 family protein [Arboricoccus pini]SNB78253.1 ubiquinone biosynthesis protein COQ9 [Arboricoccus pini]